VDQQLFLRPTTVIMQPETLCNLDCTYCYLPFRHERNTMTLAVAEAVAASVRPWAASGTVEVCWHGGEPLATGRAHLGRLMDAFAGIDVKHVIQTNATLIDEAWCEFFAERDVHVGISIDGPPADNASRIGSTPSPWSAGSRISASTSKSRKASTSRSTPTSKTLSLTSGRRSRRVGARTPRSASESLNERSAMSVRYLDVTAPRTATEHSSIHCRPSVTTAR
jgi:hypothetical protein